MPRCSGGRVARVSCRLARNQGKKYKLMRRKCFRWPLRQHGSRGVPDNPQPTGTRAMSLSVWWTSAQSFINGVWLTWHSTPSIRLRGQQTATLHVGLMALLRPSLSLSLFNFLFIYLIFLAQLHITTVRELSNSRLSCFFLIGKRREVGRVYL